MSGLANTVVVFDFETTGLSPNMGDRAIEIGAVKLVDGIVVDTFQQLMNPGFRVSSFIEGYTGISNAMLNDAPSCGVVMREFAKFIKDCDLVAHNASFDKRFLEAELSAINVDCTAQYACSMLIARRLYQNAPTHKLGDLIRYTKIENDGIFHRALADSEMTAKLWLVMLEELQQHGVHNPDFSFMQKLGKTSKSAVPVLFAKHASR
ncbi:DNA polymerase III subunit epsilon [Vibrio sp. UCD-FRSSP16_10]|uniref:3'-5' exonuclease n=1 Tax=unclassified Vibrio TaxID=2614977 RepID=UPI0007FB80BD|nr:MULTISPECIES: 3'-5' exonuclease [unclassified Vibrio]OBT17035.1 DNA polymerase III subunit epsilon [Vibrio sp. UCD-FRSSP16_30]OBT22026.1 DNA polymerase III subunit epsilon [Vibrio sp. UCD-FRSSP16_10]